MTGGTLSVRSSSFLGAFTLGGGVAGGSGTLSVGNFTWSGGSLGYSESLGGVTTVNGPATLSAGYNKNINYGHALNLNGDTTWGTYGQISIAGGDVYNGNTYDPSTVTLAAGKTLTLQGNDSNSFYISGAGTFTNNGTITKATGANNFVIDGNFVNNGTINANAGQLEFRSTRTLTGAVNVASGASLYFNGSTTLVPTLALNNVGTLTFGGNYTTLNSGTLTFGGGGTKTLANGVLGGAGTMKFDNFTWSGGSLGYSGSLGGVTTVNGPATLSAGYNKNINYGHALNLNGDTTWGTYGQISIAGGDVYNGNTYDPSTVTLAAGKTLTLQGNDSNSFYISGAGTFTNNGTITKATGANNFVIDGNFVNNGTINANAGQLEFRSTRTLTGAVNVASGASLYFNGSTTLVPTLALNNVGTLTFGGNYTTLNSGTLTFGGGGTKTLANGVLGGAGTMKFDNFTWSGGSLGYSGSLGGVTTVNGPATLSAGYNKNINYGHALNLNGDTTWGTYGQISIAGGDVYNGNTYDPSTVTLAAGKTLTLQGNDSNAFFISGAGTFTNNGTITKATGANNFVIDGNFVNSGTINANAGQLEFRSTRTLTGAVNVASGASLYFNGSTTLVPTLALNNVGTLTFGGNYTTLNSGTLTFGGGGTKTLASGVLGGAGTMKFDNFTWSGGSLGYSGSLGGVTTVNGPATLSAGYNKNINYGHALNLNGDTTWGTYGQISIAGGDVYNGNTYDPSTVTLAAGKTLTLQGNDSNAFFISGAGTFTNNGTITKATGANNFVIDGNFVNSGTINANAGQLEFRSTRTLTGAVNVASGASLYFNGSTTLVPTLALNNVGTLTFGGNYTTLNSGTLTFGGGGTKTLANGVLGGAGTMKFDNFTWSGGSLGYSGSLGGVTTVNGPATLSAGYNKNINYGHALNLNGDTTWGTYGQISIAGGDVYNGNTYDPSTVTLAAGKTLTLQGNDSNSFYISGAGTFTNNGTITKATGANNVLVQSNFVNNGTLRVQNGTLTDNSGIQGRTGTIQIDTNGTFTHTAGTEVGTLIHNGSGAQSLQLGTKNINVYNDYNNANFATGNAFSAHANVTGTGQIVGVNALQTITGAGITNGGLANATLTLGNVHVGANTYTYQIANTGTGASIRGAIQTSVNGGHLTDSRLTGSGVTASNYSAIAAGRSSGDYTVTFNVAQAGNIVPIDNQVIHFASNFDNVAGQNLSIVGSGITGFRLAAPSAAAPVDFGAIRVGTSPTQTVALTNTAPNDGFSERLNASIASSGTPVTASGSFTLLNPQASNSSALHVGFDTTSAGAKSGSAVITLTSEGSGTSNLGQTALAPQTIAVSGRVYNVAVGAVSPTQVVFANQHVGSSATQTLTVANNAAAGNFSEALNAGFSAATNAYGSGGLTNLAAGASNTSALRVGLDTGSAGARTGAVTVAFQSDGTGTNGNSGLAAIAAGSQVVNVSGNVYRYASAQVTDTVGFGNVHVGDIVTQALTIKNVAASDGYSESLNASFGGTSDARITTSGSITRLAAGASNSSSMIVGLNTSMAGTVNGAATVNFASDGAGTSNLGVTALPSQNVGVSSVILPQVAVYRLASASPATPNPVDFGNLRVGTIATQALTITNTALNDGFSEKLNASIGAATGDARASGSFTLLTAQATNSSSLVVGLDTATAGTKSGAATISLASDGTGTSGLGITPLASQTVNVSGSVFRLASASPVAPNPVVLANQHVGGAASQFLTVSNTAAMDGFSEGLNASVAAGGAATAGGSVSLLAAGATSSNQLQVGVNTATAGAKSGSVTVTLASDGRAAGNSGFSALGIGTQVVNVSGSVYRLAQAATVAPVDFGNVHVGDTVRQALTIRNVAAADGYSESLDASFGGVSDSRITTSGSIARVAAGASNGSSLSVGLDTSMAGRVDGTATLNFTSDGTGTSGLGPTSLGTQQVGVQGLIGNVYRLASPSAASPNPVNFGNVRLGSTTTRALTVTNAAPNDGFSEKLDASIGSASAGISAGGSFTLLAAQGTNSSSLVVGLDTTTAGAKSGTAVIAFASDGTGTSGLGTTALAPQTVAVSGAVYRVAAPVVAPSSISLAARVGDAAPHAGISVTNSSPDTFTERLDASLGPLSPGFTGSGTVAGLAAGATSSALGVAMKTDTAGSFSGSATVKLTSSGAGTTGAADLALADQSVTLSGHVYTPAVARVDTSTIDFGIVHKGDSVSARTVAVSNAAAATARNDSLRGSIGSAAAPFTASGTVAGLSAQQADPTSFVVGLNTGAAGVFSGSATASFASHDAELADLSLGNSTIALKAQVNNFASVGFNAAGDGRLSGGGQTYVLDFGDVRLGQHGVASTLSVLNSAIGPADLLSGNFTLSSLGTGFTLSGFGSFNDLVAGASFGGLSVAFVDDVLGSFTESLVLHATGSNASGYVGRLDDTTLILRGNAVAAVPEPGSYVLMFGGLLLVVGVTRYRRRRQNESTSNLVAQ